MEQPNEAENHARNIKLPSEHNEETDAHQKRNRYHDPDFGTPSHALPFHEGFKVIFIKLSTDEPIVKLLRAVGKAKYGSEKERHRGKYR